MNKRAKMSIIIYFLLIFLCSIATQEAMAQPSIRYDVVVKAFTGEPPECPHDRRPLNGVRVNIDFKLVCPTCCTYPAVTLWQSSGTTGTEEVERVNERGERETSQEEGRFTTRGDVNISEELMRDEEVARALARQAHVTNRFNWSIRVTLSACPADHPHPRSGSVLPSEITGSGTPDDPYVVRGTVNVFCSCAEPERRVGALISPGQKAQATAVAYVAVKEEEKVQVTRRVGGQVVATVMVNDEPRKPPKPDEGIPVSPGDTIQLLSSLGYALAECTFVPKTERVTAHDPGTTHVMECPSDQPSVVSVPGNYTGTPIENMAVTTGSIETALAPGPEKVPAVTGPATAAGGLEPVLKTGDTVIAAGQLDNSAIGSNAISVTDKNTGAVLGQAQIDMWRLAGANLNPPMVKKGQDTNLRLDVFGPPDLQLEVTATAGEGLTPHQMAVTAPIRVLQSQGLGAFTATKAGTHSVSVKALPIIYGKTKPGEKGLPIIYGK